MKVDGIELLQMIKAGKIKDKTKIREYYYGLPTKNVLEYIDYNLQWKHGEFLICNLWDINRTFEIIEEEKKIEELQLCSLNKFKTMSSDERYYITAIEYDKLNEVIRKLNKIEKEGK